MEPLFSFKLFRHFSFKKRKKMLRTAVIFIALFSAIVLTTAKSGAQNQCQGRYQSCPEIKPDFINVHLIPHTHNDLGWLKTVDQYYYGSRNDIQRAGVQYILDGVIYELLRDPKKRFVWVETAFLWQWWQEQDETLRGKVRELVNNGQFEILGGGWSMNDEAVTHYQSVIDQFTWGFRKLNDMFGTCARPRLGFQLDTFGHSQETASMMAQMGFDALFFARLDSYDKNTRLDQREMEFIWQPSSNLGKSSWLFTHVLYGHYGAPTNFGFDLFDNDEPFIDDIRSPDYNVDQKVTQFIHYVKSQQSYYKTNNVMELMGNDFNYQVSSSWFKNMDKLIKYVNESKDKGKVNVFYSTPACYLKAIHDANITEWPTEKYDFLPYSNDGVNYWTGYYTSRPTLKFFERQGNNLLQTVKRLFSQTNLGPEQWLDLTSLREIMGILQHHDAITGTEKQHVADDYAFRLNRGMEEAHVTVEKSLNTLMAKSAESPAIVMESCLLLNISQCEASEKNEKFVVTLYNPLARNTSQFFRLPVPQNEYKVFDPTGTEITIQMVPIPVSVREIPGRNSVATQELVFKAKDLPPLGFKSYYVQKVRDNVDLLTPLKNIYQIGNEHLKANLNSSSGRLDSVTLDGKFYPLKQNFLYYESSHTQYGKSSGAYMFRPESSDAHNFKIPTNITVYSGPLVQEIHQEFSDWVSQIIRIYEGETHIEFEWKVGPIPSEQIGTEVITRFSTNWETKGIFYTDSNGREMIKRVRDFRPTWQLSTTEKVSSNYYPITTAISLKTRESTLAVLPDRAQGGSSLVDGDIELMVHRRLFQDDEYGVNENLNEMAFDKALVARGRHIVVIGPSSGSSPSVASHWRHVSQSHMVLAPWILFSPTSLSLQEWQKNYVTEYSGMKASLPDNIHLLTLEPWVADSLLIRLEHFLEQTDDPQLSSPSTVNLEDIFQAFTVTSCKETTLGGDQPLEESERLVWNVSGDVTDARSINTDVPDKSNKFAVTLKPMQIRTFIIEVMPK